jgi:hypothetical protein
LLPWEDELCVKQQSGVGSMKKLVLQLLHDDPEQRMSMKRPRAACTHLVSGHTATTECKVKPCFYASASLNSEEMPSSWNFRFAHRLDFSYG